jgi:hypothetical protein
MTLVKLSGKAESHGKSAPQLRSSRDGSTQNYIYYAPWVQLRGDDVIRVQILSSLRGHFSAEADADAKRSGRSPLAQLPATPSVM